jgi:hypothetical protein
MLLEDGKAIPVFDKESLDALISRIKKYEFGECCWNGYEKLSLL